jgi:hypothetical protein
MQFVEHNKRKNKRKKRVWKSTPVYFLQFFAVYFFSRLFWIFKLCNSSKLGFVINYYVNQSKDFIKIYFDEINQINFSSIKKNQINLSNISCNFRDLFFPLFVCCFFLALSCASYLYFFPFKHILCFVVVH